MKVVFVKALSGRVIFLRTRSLGNINKRLCTSTWQTAISDSCSLLTLARASNRTANAKPLQRNKACPRTVCTMHSNLQSDSLQSQRRGRTAGEARPAVGARVLACVTHHHMCVCF